MAAITNTAITTQGETAKAYATANKKEIVFTKIAIGAGTTTAEMEDHVSLIDPKLNLPISNIVHREEDTTVWIEADMSNDGLDEGFYYREIGLFCKNPENESEEILYCYGNAGAAAEYVAADNSSTAVLKTIRVILTTSNDLNVTISMNDENHATNNYVNTQIELEKADRLSSVTNCILEIPQDLKVALEDGVFKLKQGSVLYFPNGSVYDKIVTTQDYALENGTFAGQLMVIFRKTGQLDFSSPDNFFSGETATQPVSGIFYNTTTNKIDYISSNTPQGRTYSFPIAKISVSAGVVTSIDQVFNGFGYIGSTVFVLPGVKAFGPNGKNSNGSAKSTEIVTKKVSIHTGSGSTPKTLVLNYAGGVDQPGGLTYNEKENLNYNFTSLSAGTANCGKVYYFKNKISDLVVKEVFKAADFHDFSKEQEKLNIMIDEKDFEIESLGRMIELDLTKLVVNVFKDTTPLDLNKGDTAYWVTFYYREEKHIFKKTDSDSRTLFIGPVTVNSGNNKVWCNADWQNVSGGSLSVSVSRNGASSWTPLTLGSLTDISSQPAGTSMFLMITATGKLNLKNLAWGMKA